MKRFGYTLLGLMVVLGAWGFTPDRTKPREPLASPIVVDLLDGDLNFSYIETSHGMQIEVKCRGSELQAQRLYLGDGEVAVMYEAKTSGFYGPEGKINKAGFTLKEDSTLSVPADKLEKWNKHLGEVYIKTRAITFKAKDK